MAANVSPEAILLKNILDTLTTIQKESKNTKSSDSASVKVASSAVSVDAASIKQIGDSLKILGQAIIPITKISENDIAKVTNIIRKIADVVQSIVLDKEQISAFYSMAGAFKQMSEVINSISENFFKSFFKFGPIRAHIIGKRMSRFYKIILGYLSGALEEVMNPIGNIDDPEQIKAKLSAMSSLAKLMIFDVKPGDIKKIIEMSIVLTERRGRRIARFYTGLVEELTKVDPEGKTTGKAIGLVKQISKLIGIMTISLIGLTALVVIGKENVAYGLGLLTLMVAGVYILMRTLSSDKFRNMSKGIIWGLAGITTLILGLTLSISLLTTVINKYDPKVILGSLALFTAVTLASIGIIWILSRDGIKESSVDSLITVGAILALFVGLSLSMMLAIKIGENGKNAIQGGLLILGFAILGKYVLQALAEIKSDIIIKGLIGTAGVALMIAGISAAMLVFGDFLRKLNGITDKTIKWGIGLTVGMVIGVGAIAFAAGALVTGPQAILFAAGFAAIESISLMIASISGSMLLFTELLKKINGLSTESIKNAVNKLVMKGGMVDALRTIIDALDDFGIASSIKVAAIGKAIQPVISSISQFVDVIQKMASMKIADEWDKDGKPTHYMKLKPKDFKKAAINISRSFSIFITELGIAFSKIDNKARKNMKKLNGPITNIISSICKLIEPIMQIAAGKIQIGDKAYDVNMGTLISTSKGIVDIISAMFDPLNILAEKDIKHREIKKIFRTFNKSIKQLFKIFEYASKSNISMDDSLIQKLDLLLLGGTKITTFLNSNFNNIAENSKSFKIGLRRFKKGLKHLLSIFNYDNKSILNENFSPRIENIIEGIQKIIAFLNTNGNFNNIRKNSGLFRKTMVSFKNGINTLVQDSFDITQFGNKFNTSSNNIVSGLNTITNYMTTGNFDIVLTNSKRFEHSLKHMAKGLNYIKPYLISSPKEIIDLSNAMKQLDTELIEKEERRTKAIQSVSSNFKDMAQNIEMLNKSLNNSMNLASEFNKMKDLSSQHILTTGANAIVDATVKVKDTVTSIISKDKPQENQEQINQKQEQINNNLASTIANAITIALSQWAEDHKDITIRLGEDGQAIFGSAYYG